MTTHRLYHDDAYLRTFDARITGVATRGDKQAVLLDRTAFYAEAGGQLGDRGVIAGVVVVDTQETDDGILHVLDGAPPEVGTTVACELDWARRRQHMAQHTAQHLLSGALLDRAAAPTQSARLGETALTIDVARDRIPEADLAAAEDLANDLVDDDLAIRAWFPSASELADLKLRRDPKVAADIRVVAIGDFDYSPCGGTHCARTSQLGTVRIVGAERYKGMTRVTFVTARRGRTELFTRDQVLRGLATTFSCGPTEVPAAVDKLRRDGTAADAEITTLRGRLAKMIVADLLASRSDGAIVAALPGDAELLRTIGAHITAAGRDAILCAPDDAGTSVVLFRHATSQLDCGALWKKLAVAGGRGGGRADRAEGKLTTRVDDWPAAVTAALG